MAACADKLTEPGGPGVAGASVWVCEHGAVHFRMLDADGAAVAEMTFHPSRWLDLAEHVYEGIQEYIARREREPDQGPVGHA